MIELIKEKSFSSKDSKLGLPKSTIMFDKFRIPKFTSCTSSPLTNDNRIIVYLGMSTGNIIAMTIFKQKSMFYKYEDFTLYKCHDNFNHKGPVSVMICELIESVPILFSGGVDGHIKLWQGDPELREKDMMHHIKTLIQHKGTVIALAFSRSRSLLISSSSDMTLKVMRMKDKFDKILNPRFECISVIKDFHIQLNKDKDLPYWISTLSLKETDVIELYAGDTKGRVLFYHYIDDNYLKYKGKDYEGSKCPYAKNNFNFIKEVNLHKKWTTIKVVHSIFDSVIYSAGFDNHVVCYNVKNNTKMFEVANSNSKTHFSTLAINYLTQELIVGDHVGNITFIKIFNKAEFKIKAMNNSILSIQSLDIFSDQEHLLVISEENATLYRVNRKTKVSNIQHHDAELIKIFAIEPIKEGQKIIEDAKIISSAYDNVIKMWDFLTMECINFINGPELPKKNVEVSTIAYLHDSFLIAIGTDIGNVFFWDLNRSEYLKNDYEKYIKHKSIVTGIVSFIIRGKDNLNYKEYIITCSSEGLILIWEVQKTEIKESKKKINFDEDDKFLMRNSQFSKQPVKFPYLNQQNAIEKELAKRETKNYKCIPQIKIVINSVSSIKEELKFTCVAFQPHQINRIIYSGCEDSYIYLWDFSKGNPLGKIKTSNTSVTCLTFDKNFLISGGIDGTIDIWNIPKEASNLPTLVFSLKDPSTNATGIRIHDLLMLSYVGILVACTNMKKIHLWKYEKETLLLTLSKEQEVTCLAVVESYGKLLCGTKEKTILEIDLAETLDSIGYKHDYEKYPFLKNPVNYVEDEKDKTILNKKIMDSLTEGTDIFG